MKAIWIIALLFIPLLTMLLYVIIRGSGMSERAIAASQKAQAQQVEYANAIVAQQGGGKSAADQIADAKKLHDSGAITDEEFAALKAKALA